MQSAIRITVIVGMCLLSANLVSCKKYLEAYSQNMSFIETATDLNELLIGDVYADQNNKELLISLFHISDDDFDISVPTKNWSIGAGYEHGFLHWQANPRLYGFEMDFHKSDVFYNTAYAKIARINTIIFEAERLRTKGEPGEVLNRITGEAHFLRALYYFNLVNLYGKPYRPSTANADFGVPLKISPEITSQFVARSSVKDVYEQIVKDLEKADGYLSPNLTFSMLRVSNVAVAALLSRVHLYMENYQKSINYANRVIEPGQFTLTDLNTIPANSIFLDRNSREVIFTMGGNYLGLRMRSNEEAPTDLYFFVSDNLYNGYDINDLRRKFFFTINGKGVIRAAKRGKGGSPTIDDISDKYSLRLSEMYLNKAEALVALGQNQEAKSVIQEFHKYRFKPADIPQWQYADAALIQKVREDRRQELCYEGIRWFDLRRYGVNSKYPYGKAFRHRSIMFTGTTYIENGYYELGTYAQDEAAYTLPIADDEIEFSQGRITNEVRPERPLKQ
ncbi:SusD-like starch-binding protein associating with outer membrane [Pseudobacter ginsenosidimutans]|uniref:SusD-like starch-binding protein associating with outer membrane n=2 Tax=Pseudobacter ginsenosidimutans TaxID=661488 RepID=A0A4Q7N307_9BACT|nr:RagB/SusD family nutrient uptake outer membrane protein [Pseudobacter ginsenosidimutans]RZS74675.1 SusD-like starch-binding protein associating with outer membrane [Pseudobacter ginsenosidimutans]